MKNDLVRLHVSVTECAKTEQFSDYPRIIFIACLLLLLLSRFSHVRLCVTPQTAAQQAPLSLGFSRQEHWSGLPFPSPTHESEKWKWSRSVVSNSSRPHGLQPTRLLHPWDFPGRVLEWGAIAFSVIACLTMCNVYGGNHNEKLVTTWVTLMTCRTLPLWPSTDTQKVTVQSHALHFPSVLAVTTERMLFVSWWKLSKCGTAESRILWKRWAHRKPKAYEGTAWFVLGTITWTIFPWFINPQQLLLKNPPCMLTRSVRTVVLELIYNRLVTNSSFGIK